MGCGSSVQTGTQTSPNRIKERSEKTVVKPRTDLNSVSSCFDEITQGVKSIAAPTNMIPIVCLSKEAFPVVISDLHFEDSTPTEIQLPIVAAAIVENGCVICFAQLQFLSQKYIRTADTKTLITNSLNWIIGPNQNQSTTIGIIGFDNSDENVICRTIKSLGFAAEELRINSDLSLIRAIVIPSDIDLSNPETIDKIDEFVRVKGGGLMVFYNHHPDQDPSIMPINALLIKFNLSFTNCFLNEDFEPRDELQVPQSYKAVRDSNFIPLLHKFAANIRQSHVDINVLDDIVTTLRYYIMVCNETYCEQLEELLKYAWEFLERTNFHREDGIGPDTAHAIVVVLLIDLYIKLPKDKIEPISEHETFPGKTGNVQLTDFDLTIQLQSETWISTGLWLPAGVVGTVECETPMPDVHVQIGSHHESLITKPGPWKRWPSVIQVSPLSEKVTSVVNAFGGIVYIAVNDVEPRPVRLKFHNFCRHPMADTSNPNIWKETKDIQVPWGELKTDNVIFTLPIDVLRKIDDFERINKKFNIIVDEICKYMKTPQKKPYYFVFDVELPDNCPSCGYPLVFTYDSIDGILNQEDKPRDLFTAITLMAILLIREDVFDQITETAIATVVACIVFQVLYPDFDPHDFDAVTMPKLFHELWEIHSRFDPTLIPKTLEKFQDPNYQVHDVPEDMWIAFVREMCRIGQRDFTNLLERTRPIPMNISRSLQSLPPYQFVGCQ